MARLGKGFLEGLTGLVQSPQFADFTVESGDRSWKISSLVLSAYSPFFKSICLGQFKEGQERKVKLDDDDPRAVEAMMQYFGRAEYSAGESKSDLTYHTKVFNLADKYDIEDLKNFAVERCARVYYFESINDQICNLIEATIEAYSAAPRDDRLRHTLRTMWRNPDSGVAPIVATPKGDLKSLIESVPSFGSDITMHIATSRSYVREDGCDLVTMRVHEYVRQWMQNKGGSSNLKLSVLDVAVQLQLTNQKVLSAGLVHDTLGYRYSFREEDDIVESGWHYQPPSPDLGGWGRG